MQISGPSVKDKLLPYVLQKFDWKLSYLMADLESRGVADIPGFLYRDDAAAIYKSLEKYVKSYLNPFYKKPGKAKSLSSHDSSPEPINWGPRPSPKR